MNKVQSFHKLLAFLLKKILKKCIAIYLDHDNCHFFWHENSLIDINYAFTGIEKKVWPKFKYWYNVSCRLDHKLLFGPPSMYVPDTKKKQYKIIHK